MYIVFFYIACSKRWEKTPITILSVCSFDITIRRHCYHGIWIHLCFFFFFLWNIECWEWIFNSSRSEGMWNEKCKINFVCCIHCIHLWHFTLFSHSFAFPRYISIEFALISLATNALIETLIINKCHLHVAATVTITLALINYIRLKESSFFRSSYIAHVAQHNKQTFSHTLVRVWEREGKNIENFFFNS